MPYSTEIKNVIEFDPIKKELAGQRSAVGIGITRKGRAVRKGSLVTKIGVRKLKIPESIQKTTLGAEDDRLERIIKFLKIQQQLPRLIRKILTSNFIGDLTKAKLREYRDKLKQHDSQYKFWLNKYKRQHGHWPEIKNEDFEKLHYLYRKNFEVAIVVFNSVIGKKELPFETYKELPFVDKVASFSLLASNWDSYGAAKIKEELIKRAIKFIVETDKYNEYLVFVAPLINGGVHVAFEKESLRLEFNFESKLRTEVAIKQTGKKTEHKEFQDSSFKTLLADYL